MELSVHVRARPAARAAIRPATVATRWWAPTAARLGLGLERPCAMVCTSLFSAVTVWPNYTGKSNLRVARAPIGPAPSPPPPANCRAAPPSIANGVVTACANTASGSNCNPLCNAGYSRVGTYTCNRGAWSGTPTCNGTVTLVCTYNKQRIRALLLPMRSRMAWYHPAPAGQVEQHVLQHATPVIRRQERTAVAWAHGVARRHAMVIVASVTETNNMAARPCSTAPPAVANGVVSHCANTWSDFACWPTCNSGYTLKGYYGCNLGVWTAFASDIDQWITLGPPTCNGM